MNVRTTQSLDRPLFTRASGSAFAALSGASTITVYTSASTAVPPAAAGSTLPPIAVGATLRFNGLIVSTGSGAFSMVAGVCPDGAPGI